MILRWGRHSIVEHQLMTCMRCGRNNLSEMRLTRLVRINDRESLHIHLEFCARGRILTHHEPRVVNGEAEETGLFQRVGVDSGFVVQVETHFLKSKVTCDLKDR